MSEISVDSKISELRSSYIDEEKDFLLINSKQFEDDESTLVFSNPYTSSKIQVSSFFEAIVSRSRTISSEWSFLSVPELRTRYGIKDLIDNVLLNPENRRDAIELSGGFYTQKASDFSSSVSSLSVSQYSIANLDYVNRLACLIYSSLLTMVDTYMNATLVQSCVGDVIHSTTLRPSASYNNVSQSGDNQDAMVRDLFGANRVIYSLNNIEWREPDTQWKLSAISCLIAGTTQNSAIGSTEGQTDIILSKDQLIKHSHNTESHGHGNASVTASVSQYGYTNIEIGRQGEMKGSTGPCGDVTATFASIKGYYSGSASNGTNEVSQETSNSGIRNATINVEQSYKNVYVWVRVG